jgi:hypothetical protein
MYPSYTSIYHAIPSYDGISRYMSGYQGVRIPDVSLISWYLMNYDLIDLDYDISITITGNIICDIICMILPMIS